MSGLRATSRNANSLAWLVVVVAGVVVLAVVWLYEVQGEPFFHLCAVAFGGFAIHAVLPRRFQMAFFVGLSALGAVVVLGLSEALRLWGVGLLILGCCLLPLALRWRVVAVLAVGALLAAARVGFVASPISGALWPVLGSM